MTRDRLTRRRLMQAAAASAVASPCLISSSALGNAAKAPASERVNLAHIGVGTRGNQLMGGFQKCKLAQSVAFVDCYQDRRDFFAKSFGGKALADFREVLARDDIDAVVVATPDHWHVPIAIAAARAKKDAYVEKPLGLSIEQDLACRKVFEDQGRVFQYGTQQRSMKHCRFGCELVRSGRLGKIHTIEVLAPNGASGGSTEAAPVPEGFDYAMWLGPAPQKPYTVDRCKPPGTYWVYDQSIGYLGGWGAHPLDIMVWGTDADQSGPFTVEGTSKVPSQGLYDTVYDWDMVIQTPEVKIIFRADKGDSTKFIGTEGWVDVRRKGITAEPESLLRLQLGPNDVHLVDSPRHDENFLEAVKSRHQPVSNVRDAVRSDTLSHLCNIAVRLGRKISWDPKREALLGDEEAAKMLHRPMREPWGL